MSFRLPRFICNAHAAKMNNRVNREARQGCSCMVFTIAFFGVYFIGLSDSKWSIRRDYLLEYL